MKKEGCYDKTLPDIRCLANAYFDYLETRSQTCQLWTRAERDTSVRVTLHARAAVGAEWGGGGDALIENG